MDLRAAWCVHVCAENENKGGGRSVEEYRERGKVKNRWSGI